VNLKKNKIKNYKKTRADFKIFNQKIIQNFEVTHPTKFDEGKIRGKSRKNDQFLISG
jgi:hypothetical protein